MRQKYEPFTRQLEFHDNRKKYRLFGGAAGPGKTKALLHEAIKIAENINGCDTLLLRRTFPELEASLLAQFRRDVPKTDYKSYNEAKHIVTLKNGSTVRFGYCRNENDVYQYQGAEYAFIGLDELTHFTLKQWQFLTSRNRCPIPRYTSGDRTGQEVAPCMAGATNPGNIGHAWVKALWVDKVAPAGFQRPEQYDPSEYAFIRARIEDNPIYANDVNYRKTLQALPENLRKAFLDGDWSVFAGQYFDVFEIGRHTARAEDVRIEPWAPRWISIDWGFVHPSAVYWHGAASGDQPMGSTEGDAKMLSSRPESRVVCGSQRRDREAILASWLPSEARRIVTYREYVRNGLSPRMLAQAIIDQTNSEKIEEIYLSPDAFAQRTSEASIAEQLGDVLQQNGLPRPTPADDDRIGGWQLMYQLLERDAWLITDNCSKLMECLPHLVRDDRRVEDIRKVEGDDPADAARYGLVSGVRHAGVGASAIGGPGAGQAPPPKLGPHFVPGVPLEVQIDRQISAVDPTSRAIHQLRLQVEAKKQLGPHSFRRRPR
jgi:hypothetical protein